MGENITGKDKFFALLSYLAPFPFLVLPLWAIPLLLKRDNPWVLRHAKQGVIMFLILLLFGWIPLFGWILLAVFFIFWVIELAELFQGRFFKMPIAGTISDKLKI